MEGKILAITIAIILIAALSPIALRSVFNTSAFTDIYNSSGAVVGSTGVPAWIPSILGIVGAVVFITLIIKMSGGE